MDEACLLINKLLTARAPHTRVFSLCANLGPRLSRSHYRTFYNLSAVMPLDANLRSFRAFFVP